MIDRTYEVRAMVEDDNSRSVDIVVAFYFVSFILLIGIDTNTNASTNTSSDTNTNTYTNTVVCGRYCRSQYCDGCVDGKKLEPVKSDV